MSPPPKKRKLQSHQHSDAVPPKSLLKSKSGSVKTSTLAAESSGSKASSAKPKSLGSSSSKPAKSVAHRIKALEEALTGALAGEGAEGSFLSLLQGLLRLTIILLDQKRPLSIPSRTSLRSWCRHCPRRTLARRSTRCTGSLCSLLLGIGLGVQVVVQVKVKVRSILRMSLRSLSLRLRGPYISSRVHSFTPPCSGFFLSCPIYISISI